MENLEQQNYSRYSTTTMLNDDEVQELLESEFEIDSDYLQDHIVNSTNCLDGSGNEDHEDGEDEDGHEESQSNDEVHEEDDGDFQIQKQMLLEKLNTDPTIDISTLLNHKKRVTEKLTTMESANNIPGLYYNEPLDPKCTIKVLKSQKKKIEEKNPNSSMFDSRERNLFDQPISPIINNNNNGSKYFNNSIQSPSISFNNSTNYRQSPLPSSSQASSIIMNNNRIFNAINQGSNNPINMNSSHLENIQSNQRNSSTTTNFFNFDNDNYGNFNGQDDSISKFWQKQQQQQKSYSNLFSLISDNNNNSATAAAASSSISCNDLFNFHQQSNKRRKRADSRNQRSKLSQFQSSSSSSSSFFSETIDKMQNDETTFSIFPVEDEDENDSNDTEGPINLNTTLMNNFLKDDRTFKKNLFAIDMAEFPFF